MKIHTGEKTHHCRQCDAKFAQSSGLRSHIKNNHTKEGIARRKKKEERIAKLLKDNEIIFEREFTVPFSCFKTERKCARVDFVIAKAWGYILLEVDENQHSREDVSCETKRMMNIVSSVLSNNKLLFIRYNPDSFKVDGVRCKLDTKTRHTNLINFINNYSPSDSLLSVKYLNYDSEGGQPTFFDHNDFSAFRDLLIE